VSAVGQVAKALEHAHENGLAHGRLSGDDVLVCDDDRVKLCGLGVAGPGRDADKDLAALVALFLELGPAAGGPPAALAARWADHGAPDSAHGVRHALLALDTGPDDATPMTGGHPTPPAGIRVAPRRGWIPLVALTLLAGGALALAVSLIGRGGGGGAASTAGDAITVTASSFDPEARPPTENEESVANAVDGDPSTSWATERYNVRPFAGLKKGVGIILRATDEAAFSQLALQSPSRDWAASVYVADSPAPTLAGWGAPVARQPKINRIATFDLRQARGRAVLLWITDTGPQRRVVIDEARLVGRR
jgi:hypothetical protein